MKILNYKYLFLILLGFGLIACEDQLEIDPRQSLPTSSFPGSVSDINAMVTGTYGNLSDADLAGSNFILVAEIMTNNTVWTGSFQSYRQLARLEQDPNNVEVVAMWNDAYETINQCNLVLDAIQEIDPNDAEGTSAFRGEVLFIRGWLYFEMTRWFGQQFGATSNTDLGVPIVTSGVSSIAELALPARSTVAECYTQAVNDLTEAATLLGTSPVREGGATSLAATAMLMRIALQQGDFATADTHASTIIDSGQFSLLATYEDVFRNEFNVEMVYEVSHTVLDNPGVNTSLPANFFVSSAGARDDIDINTGVVDPLFTAAVNTRMNNAFDAAMTADPTIESFQDERALLRIANNTSKYEDGEFNADNPPTVRYSEILLTKAETEARLNGVTAAAVDLLNQVRARSFNIVQNGAAAPSSIFDYELADFATADELVDAILLERRIELLFEGQFFYDLKRLGLDISTGTIAGTIPFNDNFAIFPIPQREIDANSSILQNPGF